MNVHMIEESRDNGRKVVPLHTGKVQIGRCYQPKPKAQDARWIERHTRPRLAVGKWLAYSSLAMLAVLLMARHG